MQRRSELAHDHPRAPQPKSSTVSDWSVGRDATYLWIIRRKPSWRPRSSKRVPCADSSLDAVLSRFGLLLFGDVQASAHELARVLRVGGSFSLAVWDAPADNTLVHALLTALRPRVPAELMAPFDQMAAWAAEGRRTRLLQDAGLKEVRSEDFRWP